MVTTRPEESVSLALKMGCDLNCGESYQYLLESLKEGLITEEQITEAAVHLFTTRYLLGIMGDGTEYDDIPYTVIENEKHISLAHEASLKSCVLLKNNGILPLKAPKTLAVIGPNAADSVAMWGNYNGFPVHTVTVAEGIAAKIGADRVVPAADADVVIYVGGISPRMEGEEMRNSPEGFDRGDRTTIEFPRVQRAEIDSLARLGKQIVLVNFSGSAMGLLPETERCAAILQAWYPGEAGGTAIADVLFGDCNPSGRLPVTFYRSDADLPAFDDYNMAGHTYRYFTGDPLFHFGHGLSYSSFRYGRARVRNHELIIKVRTRSRVEGDEVIQVYMAKREDAGGPQKTLRAFRRVHVPARGSATVRIPLDATFYATYDEASGEMRATPGRFTVWYGHSAAPQDLRKLKIRKWK
jgi:beta-glucosidase